MRSLLKDPPRKLKQNLKIDTFTLFLSSGWSNETPGMLKACQALENIRKFKYLHPLPLSSVWPSTRRSAVLVLLFIGHKGELRVLLTKRSRGLSSFSGHVSLPGGKADDEKETFEQVARRESEEEIGLPRSAEILHKQFGMKIDNLTGQMPCYLSRTFLSVKPMVCFLHNDNSKGNTPLDATRFFGKLNPGETASIFSVPLNDLVYHLFPQGQEYKPEYVERRESIRRWGGLRWPIGHYYYPIDNPHDVAWLNVIEDTSSADELEEDSTCRDLWGLTAKILFDLSRIANGVTDNNDLDMGNEELLYGLHEFANQLQPGKRSDWEIGMITGEAGFKYKDVRPGYYLEQLKRCTKY